MIPKEEKRNCPTHGDYIYPRWTRCELCHPVPPPESKGLDLEALADWLEQAERVGARADMSHPALIAWAKSGYAANFSTWMCMYAARRLRAGAEGGDVGGKS